MRKTKAIGKTVDKVDEGPRVTRRVHAVTGAFGYSGRYIAQKLMERDLEVRTLTNSTGRNSPLSGRIVAHPFNFHSPSELVDSLRDVSVLYNTYWTRFNHKSFSHAEAVSNTMLLFECALKAGVGRIVHISITNPSEDSSLEYFRGKAHLEKALMRSGMSYAILRPTVLFGMEDILVNNIAWFLRRLPVFGVFGSGGYRIQPLFVEDLADLAVEAGQREGNEIIDAIGPETFTYRELVRTIALALGKRRLIVSISPELAYWSARLAGWLLKDVVVTREEIKGLIEERLYVDAPSAGATRFSEWVRDNRVWLGRRYANELGRRTDRNIDYRKST